MPFRINPPPKDNEIECTRCNAHFYFELSRCPQCGVNVYKPEDEVEEEYDGDKVFVNLSFGNLLNFVKNIFRRITGRSYSAQEVFGDSLEQAALYNDLLGKVGGDHNTVERLVAFEEQKMPDGYRKIWMENAIKRWERDNRIPGI
jgi:hypothetical protein